MGVQIERRGMPNGSRSVEHHREQVQIMELYLKKEIS